DNWNPIDIPNPLAGLIRIGAFLPELFLALIILHHEGAVGFLVLDTLNGKPDRAVCIAVEILDCNDLPRSRGALCSPLAAVQFRPGLSRQRLARVGEVDTIEKLHERDRIAAGTAAAAIEDLLRCVDGKPILTVALGTGTATLVPALAIELDAATP